MNNLTPQEGIQWAAFVSGVLGVILLLLRQSVPVLVKRFGRKQNVESKRDEHKLDVEKREDKLSFEAKEFLTDLARDNIQTVKTQAEKDAKELSDTREELKTLQSSHQELNIKFAKLEATEELKKIESDGLKAELKKMSSNFNLTKDSLQGAMSEIDEIRRKLEEKSKQKEDADKKIELLEQKLEKEIKSNKSLERKFDGVLAELKIKEGLLEAANGKIELLNSREENIKLKLGEYRQRLRQHDLMQPEEEKQELMRTDEFFALQSVTTVESKPIESFLKTIEVEVSEDDTQKMKEILENQKGKNIEEQS